MDWQRWLSRARSYPSAAAAQTGQNVLVVVNTASAPSAEIAQYYAQKRQVPAEQVVRLDLPLSEEISRGVYERQLERPVADWLAGHSAQDRILYIVLTKGVPLRIEGTDGAQGTVASVDSELTLLYRKLSQVAVQVTGSIKNPYFLSDAPISTARPFTHRVHDLYLVTRLDGYTVTDVKGLIDRGAAPVTAGRILLDGRPEPTSSPGNQWLTRADSILTSIAGWKDRVVHDDGVKVLHGEGDVLGYYSWGSNDPMNATRDPQLTFLPGAIGGMFVSTDARTLREPPTDWKVREQDFGGSRQSLMGDLIRSGLTGVAGHVAEPYLNGTIRPDILFPAYVSGMNLAEAFYLAMPFVSWQTIIIGDPLCAPFRSHTLTAAEISEDIDEGTGLPALLSERRVTVIASTGVKKEAARLFVKSDVLLAHGDRTAAHQALEEATRLDETFAVAHLALAGQFVASADWDAAIDRFQRVLKQMPNNAIALNDLAFVLAVHKNEPAAALPLAKRAYDLANRNPLVADTLAWVQHLLGDNAAAEPLLIDATGKLPANAEIHLHAAVVLAAVGKIPEASRELTTAVALEPALEEQSEVLDLRRRLASR